MQAALKRFQLDYVDLVFCHRPDVYTPIEETVRAMNFVIEQGWAFYWGTSEWSAQQITEVRQSLYSALVTLCVDQAATQPLHISLDASTTLEQGCQSACVVAMGSLI